MPYSDDDEKQIQKFEAAKVYEFDNSYTIEDIANFGPEWVVDIIAQIVTIKLRIIIGRVSGEDVRYLEIEYAKLVAKLVPFVEDWKSGHIQR